ncbi:hypothetical protein [Parasphingopyxis lamellibrachiae]|uniref:Uncharacterized protein n=1 Tax=Parasphingopyxis lamellibrachiae TaxID=680125 RepID=A0A3D9FGM4_9SPHN|nr:hypothetical protein [Parasphingopyxis lamellibrachiae]RED16913.1 hypothetical protein DFR46_1947 [Parasphingopyxis lamellibrachiae]
MTRSLALMTAISGTLTVSGLALLVRPAAVRNLLSISESEGAAYALRIIGAMLFAAGLFVGGFAATLSFNS